MSSTTEDRLTAALRARAGQVTPEELGPLEVPVPARRRRPLYVGLVAAALAAAVATPFVVRGIADAPTPAPAPAPPVTGKQVGDGVRINVDGSGLPETVRLTYDASTGEYEVVAGQITDRYVPRGRGTSVGRPTLIGAADLDGDGREEVAVNVGDDTADLPAFFRFAPGDGIGTDRLVRLGPPGSVVGGWRPGADGNRWDLRKGRLVTWRLPTENEPAGGRLEVPWWVWHVQGDRLVPSRHGIRCVADGEAPVGCGKVPIPLQQQRRADFDGDGRRDVVRLTAQTFPKGVEEFEVSVELATGETLSAGGPPGWAPELLSPVPGPGGTWMALVRQEGGDSDLLRVFGVVDGRLVHVKTVGGPGLRGGFDAQGRSMGYWIAHQGQLMSWRSLGPPSFDVLDVEVWEWVVDTSAGPARLRAEPRGTCSFDAAQESFPSEC